MNAKQLTIKNQINAEVEITLSAYEDGEITLQWLAEAVHREDLYQWQRAAYAVCLAILK